MRGDHAPYGGFLTTRNAKPPGAHSDPVRARPVPMAGAKLPWGGNWRPYIASGLDCGSRNGTVPAGISPGRRGQL